MNIFNIEGIDASGKDTILDLFIRTNNYNVMYITPKNTMQSIIDFATNNTNKKYDYFEEFFINQLIHIYSRAFDDRLDRIEDKNKSIIFNRSPISTIIYSTFIAQNILNYQYAHLNNKFLYDIIYHYNKHLIGTTIFIDVDYLEIFNRLTKRKDRDPFEQYLIEDVNRIKDLIKISKTIIEDFYTKYNLKYYILKVNNNDTPEVIYKQIKALIDNFNKVKRGI